MAAKLSIRVNGNEYSVEVGSETLLLDALRYECGLTGTKLGCGTGDCGACTVLMDGRPVNSCLVYALECEGAHVETIEGVVSTPIGRTIVDEMIDADAAQCGFCTPGIVVTACALARKAAGSPPREQEIATALAGNLCRCTGYLPIQQALRSALDKLAQGREPS